MSTTTSIEWTDVTWNPVRGCSLVSAGCANCYAMKQAHRFSGTGKPYEGLTEIGPQGPRWNGKVRLVPEALEEPLHWKQPRRVFVNSMSDLFHEDVPDEFIAAVFGVMCVASHHTYQILTKRPERMRTWFGWIADRGALAHYVADRCDALYPGALPAERSCAGLVWSGLPERATWPLPNVWLGVSVEDQATADERIPILLQTPAAVRFISAEPLLSRVSIIRYLYKNMDVTGDFRTFRGKRQVKFVHEGLSGGLHWAIIGGESGPRARPCDLAWIRSIKDQCQAAEVPVFIKQIGARWYDKEARCGIRGSVAVPIDRPWMWVTQRDRKGGDFDDAEFPVDLRVRDFPNT